MGSELFQFLRGKTDITLTNPIQYLFKNPSPSFNALFSRGNEISGKVACEISVVSTIDHPRMPISFYFRLNEIGPRKSIFTRRHKEFQLKVPLPSSRQVNPRNLELFPPTFIVAAVISRISARTKVIDSSCAESKEEEEEESSSRSKLSKYR